MKMLVLVYVCVIRCVCSFICCVYSDDNISRLRVELLFSFSVAYDAFEYMHIHTYKPTTCTHTHETCMFFVF